MERKGMEDNGRKTLKWGGVRGREGGREGEGEGGREREREGECVEHIQDRLMLIQTLWTYLSCSYTGCSHNVSLLIGDLNPLTELMVPHQY